MTNHTYDSLSVKPSVINFGWLRSPPFDITLIVGVAALALFTGGIVVLWPKLFVPVLVLDLWFLGYHHVVATFTRIAFDAESFKQYKFFVLWLPLIVAGVATLAVFVLGPWILASAYLYWQWFHYTRQSYGIARIYQLKGDPQRKRNDGLVIYLLPLAGILYRSYQNPGTFLAMEFRCIPVAYWVFQVFFAAALAAIVYWIGHQLIDYRNGRFSLAYCLYMISHAAIFGVGYLAIKDINTGWLVLNIWHNAQYILFVWMYNNKRLKGGVDLRHRFLSTISQTKNQWLYYGVCLGISSIVYWGISKALGAHLVQSIPIAAVIIYQTLNFHHYVVDAIVWKVRQKPVRKTLDLVM